MKTLFYKILLLSVLTFSGGVLFTSCEKDDSDTTVNTGSSKDYFTSNMLKIDLKVAVAKDDGVDTTNLFNGYTFRLTDTATYSGFITAANDLFSVRGTWYTDESYNKITFAFPTSGLQRLAFFNKEWQFENTTSTTIYLKPTNGENDALQFVKK